MASLPLVALINAESDSAAFLHQVISGVLNQKDLSSPDVKLFDNEADGYMWHIDNKYYTADIILYSISCTGGVTPLLSKSLVEAAVICLSSNEPSLNFLEETMKTMETLDLDVRLLAIHSSPTDDISSLALKYGVEIVNFGASDDYEDEDDPVDPDIRGIERIKDALQAHIWSNIKMKTGGSDASLSQNRLINQLLGNSLEPDSPSFLLDDDGEVPTRRTESDQQSSDNKQSSDGQHCSSSSAASKQSESDSSPQSSSSQTATDESTSSQAQPSSDDILNECLRRIGEAKADGSDTTNDEPDFEVLFRQMHLMKEKAQDLPPAERKAFAEKVTLAFWKSIGGDESEIAGLSDSD